MKKNVAISVQDVGIRFNLNHERVDNLKEFVIKGPSASHFHYNDSLDQYATGLNSKTVTVSVTSNF